MTTIYRLHRNRCKHCDHSKQIIKIGLSAVGWCFQFNVYPSEGISSIDDWKRELNQGEIIDENGNILSVDELLTIITERDYISRNWDDQWWTGYESEEEFHKLNYSKRGPSGLLRTNHYGTKPGIGTWDYYRRLQFEEE